MIIKEEKKKKRKTFFSFKKFLYFYFYLSLLAFTILLAFVLQSYTFIQLKNKYLDIVSKGGRFEYIYLPQIAFKALQSNFHKLDKINLEINFDDILIIENIRKKAIDDGYLPPANLIKRVKANIVFNEKKNRGDLRLKGDRKVHFQDKNKSSYKIELDRNQYILGMKKFSIQKPRIRNYIHEWLFHEMAGDFNIIKIKYDFINLYINGEDKGLYVLEEGFGKELIERNERRNGPIFSLNEDIYDGADEPVFEIYNKNYWDKKENNPIARIASQKLRDFFNKELEVDEIFDLNKWAAYFAVIDMTASYHGGLLKSVKFYYNPLNGLFEPIPFDGHRHKPNFHKYNLNYDNKILIDFLLESEKEDYAGINWLKKFFFKNGALNKKFYNKYVSNLNKISSENYINEFLSKNLKKIKIINSHIYGDYFFYDNIDSYGAGIYYFLKKDFIHQANNIQQKLKNKQAIQILQKKSSELLVKFYFNNYGILVAEKLICSKNNQPVEILINEIINNFNDTVIKIPEKHTNDTKCKYVEFKDKNKGDTKIIKIDYINSRYSYDKFKKFNLSKLDNYFIRVNNNLFLKGNQINIDEDLYIPNGYKVIIKPGQKIILTNSAFIISNSPWKIGGNEKKTTISGEKNNLGGGLYIGDTNEITKIENTEFSYLNGYNINLNSEYLILGSINFHDTNLEINNVQFKDIFSEDAINVFRSNFKITNASYEDIFSDAIDIDFSKGDINKTRFMNIKNDAIDFSGSIANVNDAFFENVNDKIISVGEKSKINLSSIKAINSFVGIASKDGSNVYSDNLNFDGVLIPFAAYQKKKEYNHGNLVAKNFSLNNFSKKWIKDKKSKIIVNDILVENVTKKIIPIIYEKKISLLKNN